MATTNIQSFAGDVEVSGELTVTGQLNSTTGSDKVKLTATTASETDYIPLSRGTTGAQPLYTDSNLTYNPANNVIGANVSGNAAFATNATYATNAGQLGGRVYSEVADVSTIASRNAGGHLYMVYGFSEYLNMSHAAVQRNADTVFYSSNDDYLRKTNAAGMRSSLVVPTRTGGDASGTWNINVNGNAAFATNATYANSAGSATNATYANSAGSATNATYANNSGALQGRGYSEGANASTIVSRDNAADINCRLLRPTFANQGTISGAMAFRVNNSNDNYLRFCSSTSAIRSYLNVPEQIAGSVVQVQAYDQKNKSRWNYNGTLHISNVNGTISPRYNNSKILCTWELSCATTYDVIYRVYRNNSLVGYNPQDGTNIWSGVAGESLDVNGNSLYRHNISYIDSPGTTSQVTYKLYLRDSYTGNTNRNFALNRVMDHAGRSTRETGISTILMTEIKQ